MIHLGPKSATIPTVLRLRGVCLQVEAPWTLRAVEKNLVVSPLLEQKFGFLCPKDLNKMNQLIKQK